MPEFGGLPRATLLSISHLSGEDYQDVAGDELMAELSRRGFQATMPQLIRLMHQLQDAGYVRCTFAGGYSGMDLIGLEHLGRQEVEGWPVAAGQPTGGDVEALVDALLARSEDATVPEPERGKARAAASALRDLGVSVTGEVIAAWLKHLGVG